MATKKAKQPEFPNEVFVYKDIVPGENDFLIVDEFVDNVASSDPKRVGVYQLVRIITVKTEVKIVVEEE